MFRVLLTATLGFFDTTPSGAIVNVFSGDVDLVDTKLPDTAQQWVFLLVGGESVSSD